MKAFTSLCAAFWLGCSVLLGQAITVGEYFFDVDPGQGYGTAFPVAAGDTVSLALQLDVNGLEEGLHTLSLRFRDADGHWGIATGRPFQVVEVGPGPASAIVAAEYFVDTDPGQGLGTPFPVTTGNMVDMALAVDVSGLDEGIHTLSLRFRDADGHWGIAIGRPFQVVEEGPGPAPAIVAGEYFFDVDPGQSLGTSFPVTAGDTADLALSVDVNGLNEGLHTLSLRFRDAEGHWGIAIGRAFQVVEEGAGPAPAIVAGEYFFDVDPGQSLGTSFPVTAGDTVNLALSVDVDGLAEGLHTLSLRFRDADGHWGIAIGRSFQVVEEGPGAAPAIVAGEYFFDVDPGQSLGTDFPVTAGDTVNLALAVDVNGLNEGIHTLSLRFQDAEGHWGIAIGRPFQVVEEGPGAAPAIVAGEYFFDVDPGQGLGTPFPVTAGDTVDLALAVDVNGLAEGLHTLSLRFQDADGHWGIAIGRPFQVVEVGPGPAPAIVAGEYFFDVDPGQGLGTPFPVTAGDTVDLALSVDVNGLAEGLHTLSLRFRDADGHWGIAIGRPFQVVEEGPGPAPAIVAGEYFFDVDPGQSLGTSFPVTAGDTVNLALSVDVNDLTEGLHTLSLRFQDADGHWGIAIGRPFQVVEVGPGPAPAIVAGEYFFDVDPGQGLGTSFPVTAGDTVNLALSVDVNGLAEGLHTLSLRFRDADGHWGIAIGRSFQVVEEGPGPAPAIVAGEYFFDVDPGQSLGTSFPVTAGDTVDFALSVDVNGLAEGLHTLSLRFQDAEGHWGIAIGRPFQVVEEGPGAAPAIVAGEYFFDVDPGQSLGTSFPVTAGDTVDFALSVDVNGLAEGLHTLSLRFRDSEGHWGIAIGRSFQVVEDSLNLDCNGVPGGTAYLDDCNTCVGGDTGLDPCLADCNGLYGGTALPGSSCDDGDTNTTNDVYDANCTCAGTPVSGCNNNLELDFQTDANPGQTTWEISAQGGAMLVTGGPLQATNGTQSQSICLPDGCYTLSVYDSAGDGIANGGYVLRRSGGDAKHDRIIDNTRNFSTGSVSVIGSGPAAFCFPMAEGPRPMFHHQDRLDFTSGQYLVSEEDAAVSAVWIANGTNSVQSTNTGYEFWLFDPNGSYSYRRFRNHATSDNFGNVGATRACHMKINNWSAAQHAPQNMLLNVRIRSRVNGVNANWGPSYRFKIDPARAACPLTQLNDTPDNVALSCNQTRAWGNGNWIHARPISGANKYQFRFRIASEGFNRVITSNTYFLQLNWATSPLLAGRTYDVDVRASMDGGATWCTAAIAPALTAEWGVMCTLTIAGGNAQGGGEQLALDNEGNGFAMYPNPNSGDQLWLSLAGIEAGVNQVSVDIYDLAGHRAVARLVPTQGEQLQTMLDLNGELAAGVYVVHVMAGNQRYTERLVITQ